MKAAMAERSREYQSQSIFPVAFPGTYFAGRQPRGPLAIAMHFQAEFLCNQPDVVPVTKKIVLFERALIKVGPFQQFPSLRLS